MRARSSGLVDKHCLSESCRDDVFASCRPQDRFSMKSYRPLRLAPGGLFVLGCGWWGGGRWLGGKENVCGGAIGFDGNCLSLSAATDPVLEEAEAEGGAHLRDLTDFGFEDDRFGAGADAPFREAHGAAVPDGAFPDPADGFCAPIGAGT